MLTKIKDGIWNWAYNHTQKKYPWWLLKIFYKIRELTV